MFANIRGPEVWSSAASLLRTDVLTFGRVFLSLRLDASKLDRPHASLARSEVSKAIRLLRICNDWMPLTLVVCWEFGNIGGSF